MKHKQNFFSAKHYYKFNYDLNVTDVCYRHRSVITCFSLYGLKSLSKGIINSYQLEFVRRKFKRRLRKKAKFWLRYLPNLGRSKKPAQMRMGKGKGKGNFYTWICKIPSGCVIAEVGVRRKFLVKFLKSIKTYINIPFTIVYPQLGR